MRRLLAFTVIVILTGAMFASAALLEVEGGTIQGFHSEAELGEGEEPACENDECLTDGTEPSPTSSTIDEEDEPSTTTSESTSTSVTSTSSEATVTTVVGRLVPSTTLPR